jgi:hypothetical protein
MRRLFFRLSEMKKPAMGPGLSKSFGGDTTTRGPAVDAAKYSKNIPSLPDRAMEYADRGWPVFPLIPGGKTPATGHGFKDATTSRHIVREWWKANPNYNIGIATGHESGLVVFDFDVKKDQLGREAYVQLQKTHALDTLMSHTPSGGIHLLFHYDGDDIGNRAGIIPGLDIRGSGGYIVAPGSLTPEGEYKWDDDSIQPAPLPDGLQTLLKPASKANTKGFNKPVPFDRKSVLDGVPEGQRDDKLYRYVCSLQAKGSTRGEAEILARVAAENCQPPFDVSVALEKVARVYDKYDSDHKIVINREVSRLSSLEMLDYEIERETVAKGLGIRVSVLDGMVAKHRINDADEAADEVVEELSPWDEPVAGDVLLAEIIDQITRHTVMQAGCPTVASIWSLASFCINGFRVFPKLQLKSPEKRCGKSTLMECLEGVTCRPLLTTNITASSLFRCIEAWKPTLLIDEADTFARDNDELNGIINAGHTRRTAYVIRTVKENDDHKPKRFCVWSPQVIAGIKNQRDTLEDRSICIEMRRKLPSESVRKIPINYFEQNQHIRRKCIRWAEDHIGALKKSDVYVPPCGNDRAQDNWFPIFAIAQLAGGEWPDRVLSAYLMMESPDYDKDDSVAVMLLADIKTVFDEVSRDRIHSDELVNHLTAMDDRPWPEWKHGKPMTKASLSRLLKPHKIKARQLKVAGSNLNGYEKSMFKDAFDRYLSVDTPPQNSTTLQPSAGAGFGRFQTSTSTTPVELQNSRKPSAGAGCREVELSEGGTDGERVTEHSFHYELTGGDTGMYRADNLESARHALTKRYGERLVEVIAA